MNYNVLIFILLISAIVIAKIVDKIKYYFKNYSIEIMNQDRYIPNDMYYLPHNAHHIFWDGGLSSSFRISQVIISMKRYVQPIYIEINNNINNTINTNNIGDDKNKNNNTDIINMLNYKDKLFNSYPDLIHLLRPTIIVNNIKNYDIKKLINIFCNDYIYPIEYPTYKDNYKLLFSNKNIKIINGDISKNIMKACQLSYNFL